MDGAHRVPEGVTVIVEGDRIVLVGEDAPAGSKIHAAGMVVVPGLVNVHSHSTNAAFTGNFLAESTRGKDYGSLYRVLHAVRNAIDEQNDYIYRIQGPRHSARLHVLTAH